MPWSSNKFQEILNILCEGFKTRSNFRGLKLHLNKRYAIQNLPKDNNNNKSLLSTLNNKRV